jgi:hypothetical protein
MLISHEQLFVHTVQDLRSKIRRNTTYSLIRACGLCRHLLLDGATSLIHQVNRNHKLQIRFHIRDYENSPISHDYNGSGGRTILPIGKSKFVKEGDFLATKIHYSFRDEFTVKDFILTGAHYYGGVHTGVPDLKQKQLARLNRFYHKETNASFWHIACICKVVLRALKPLEAKIKPNPLPVDFNHNFTLPNKHILSVSPTGR